MRNKFKKGIFRKLIPTINRLEKKHLNIMVVLIFILMVAIIFSNTLQRKKIIPTIKKNPYIEQKQTGLGFGLKIPKSWKGKYFTEERVFQDVRYIDYYLKGKNNDNWLLFTVSIMTDSSWQNILNSNQVQGMKKINSFNGNTIVITRSNRIPEYKTANYQDYQKLSADIDSLANNLFLTGEYNYRTINVYFARNVDKDCSHTEAIQRVLDHRGDYERGALLELLNGPTIEEKELGFSSLFSSNSSDLLGFKIINKTAYLNFKDIRQKIPNASSSCGGAQLLSEIEQTLLQFPSIKKIAIAINGQPKIFYEWLLFECPDDDTCNPANFQTIN